MPVIEKLKKYKEWYDKGLLVQSALPDIDPTRFPEFIRSHVLVCDVPARLESVDFFDGGSFEVFVRILAGDLFFYGNSFLTSSEDLNQISAIGLAEVLRILESSGKDFDIEALRRNYSNILHLKIRPGKTGVGVPVLDPVSDLISGLFTVLDYTEAKGAPPDHIKKKFEFDEVAYKAIAEALNFKEFRSGIYFAPPEFLNDFLHDIIGPLNRDFAVWLRNKYSLARIPKIVKVLPVTE